MTTQATPTVHANALNMHHNGRAWTSSTPCPYRLLIS